MPTLPTLDVSTLLAGAVLVLLGALGWYAYARGTRHGQAEEGEAPGDQSGPPHA